MSGDLILPLATPSPWVHILPLVRCPECRRTVSTEAIFCPQCAYPYPGRNGKEGNRSHGVLRSCPDCRGVVSIHAKACPHCGSPFERETPDNLAVTRTKEGAWLRPHGEKPFVGGPNEGGFQGTPTQKTVLDELSNIDTQPHKEERKTHESFRKPDDITWGEGRKTHPLWGDVQSSQGIRPRFPRLKVRGTRMALMLTIAILGSAAVWKLWTLKDLNALEALVYWNW